jgi:hypothetical protein
MPGVVLTGKKDFKVVIIGAGRTARLHNDEITF